MPVDPVGAASPASVAPLRDESLVPCRKRLGNIASIQAAAASVEPLKSEIREITKAIQSLVREENNVKATVFWLQVAATVIFITAPIFSMALTWWVTLPTLGVGITIFGLFCYFSSQHARLHADIVCKDESKNKLEDKLLDRQIANLVESGRSDSRVTFLPTNPQEAHRGLRDILNRMFVSYLEGRKATAKYNYLDLAGGEYIGACSSYPVEDAEPLARRRKVSAFTTLIEKKQKSLAQAAKTAFVLQVASYVVLAVAPILGLTVGGLAPLLLFTVGWGPYVAAWHFAERRDADQSDLSTYARERKRGEILIEEEEKHNKKARENVSGVSFKKLERKQKKRSSIESLDLAIGPHNRTSFWVNNLAHRRVYFARP